MAAQASAGCFGGRAYQLCLVVQKLATCDVESLKLERRDSEMVVLNHPTLQSLELEVYGDYAVQLGDLPGLEVLHLYLRHCTCMARCNSLYAQLDQLRSLQCLTLSVPGDHEDFDFLHTEPIQHLTGLQTLRLNGCSRFTELTLLQHFTDLRTLSLAHCARLDDLRSLQLLTSLRALDLSFGGFSDLRPLQLLTGLRCLYLSSCEKLFKLSPLQHVTSLQTLLVGGFRPGLGVLTPLDWPTDIGPQRL